MSAEPSELPTWATSGTNRATPDSGYLASGFLYGERPPPKWANWLWGLACDWIAHLRTRPLVIEVTSTQTINFADAAYSWCRYGEIWATAAGGGGGAGNATSGGGGGGSGAVGGFRFSLDTSLYTIYPFDFTLGAAGGGGISGGSEDGSDGSDLIIETNGQELLRLDGGWAGLGGANAGTGGNGRCGGGGGSSGTGPGGNGGFNGSPGIAAGVGGGPGNGAFSSLLALRDWGMNDVLREIKEATSGGTGPQGGGGGGQGVHRPTGSPASSAFSGFESSGSTGGLAGGGFGAGGGGGGGGTDPGDGGKGANAIALAILW